MDYVDNDLTDQDDVAYWQQQVDNNPQDWRAALNLSTLQIKYQATDKALQTMQTALDNHPEQPELWRQLGNIKRYQNQPQQAQQAYQYALKLNPQDAQSLNHLGLIAFNQQQWTQAQDWFQQALRAQPDYIGAMYNLALSYKHNQQLDDATACLLAILDANPQHWQSYIALGRIALQSDVPQKAEWAFQQAASIFPDDSVVLETIAQILLDHEHYRLARPYFDKLTQLAPDNPGMWYNLGVINEKDNKPSQALTCYQQALEADPDYFPALNNAGVACLALEQRESAKFYFQQALQRRPGDESLQYTLSALEGKSRVKAPEQYIEQLFDAYADHFDQHLVMGLDYQIPELLRQACEPYLPTTHPDLLDLGCGTGLAAEAFATFTRSIVGVDLSQNMLDKARDKRIFADLHHAPLTQFLQNHDKAYDIIIAGDVFTYFGDLDTIFRHCQRLLNNNGLFCFSIERTQSAGYQLQASGRFAHHPAHIKELTDIHELEWVQSFKAATRQQNNEAVAGEIILLRKLDQD